MDYLVITISNSMYRKIISDNELIKMIKLALYGEEGVLIIYHEKVSITFKDGWYKINPNNLTTSLPEKKLTPQLEMIFVKMMKKCDYFTFKNCQYRYVGNINKWEQRYNI